MDVEKKLSLMGSKILFATFIIFFNFFLLSCDSSGHNEKLIVKDILNINNNISTKTSFLPDSTVNLILILNNVRSLNQFIPNTNKIKLTEYLRQSPVIVFLNKNKDEFLLAYQFEGSTKNNFFFFEFGFVKDLKD